MASTFQRDLKKLSRHLVQIHRPQGMPTVFGFVVDSSDELVLLHHFNSEVFCLDGDDAIRHCDIRSFCFFDDPRYWRYRALRRLKIRPIPPRPLPAGPKRIRPLAATRRARSDAPYPSPPDGSRTS